MAKQKLQQTVLEICDPPSKHGWGSFAAEDIGCILLAHRSPARSIFQSLSIRVYKASYSKKYSTEKFLLLPRNTSSHFQNSHSTE